jgi:hypothetical protein
MPRLLNLDVMSSATKSTILKSANVRRYADLVPLSIADGATGNTIESALVHFGSIINAKILTERAIQKKATDKVRAAARKAEREAYQQTVWQPPVTISQGSAVQFGDITPEKIADLFKLNQGQTLTFKTPNAKEGYTEIEIRVPINPSDVWIAGYMWEFYPESYKWGLSGGTSVSASASVMSAALSQSYRDGGKHCVFDPIQEMADHLIAEYPSNKNYAALTKKINKLRVKFDNGVPDDEMEYVANTLKIKIVIRNPLDNEVINTFSHDNALFTAEFYNARHNHLEKMAKQSSIACTVDELYQIRDALISRGDMCVYKMCSGQLVKVMHAEGSYTTVPAYRDALDACEKTFAGCRLDYDLPVSKFIEAGVHMTQSIQFRKKYTTYIDETKSYAQSKACAYYEGFLAKVTDFRACDSIQALGYYKIGAIDWSDADAKLVAIQKKFNFYADNGVYFSPVLKMLAACGVKFQISGGCWGSTVDFEFAPEMYEKDDGVSRYARAVGLWACTQQYDELKMRSTKEFAANLMTTQECVWHNGVATFRVPRKRMHMLHVSGAVYAYQQMRVIEQLRLLDINRVAEVRVDGIKFSGDYKLIPTYRLIEQHTPMIAPSKTFITNSPWDGEFAAARDHHMIELHVGMGGAGKTHKNLLDTGLVNVLYVAPSHKLERSKVKEYGVKATVLANLKCQKFGGGFCERKHAVYCKYNVIIIDETTMVALEELNYIKKIYPLSKLIFCGDIGYQLDCIHGTPMKTEYFDNVIRHEGNHRCV